MRGDVTLEVAENQPVDPGQQISNGQLTRRGDVSIGDPDVEGRGLKLGAATVGADLSRLILAKEDADVLLVFLLLEIYEKGTHSLVAAGLRRQEHAALVRLELR